MNTCGTCKYFGKLATEVDTYDPDKDYEPVPNTRLHVCELLKHLNASGEFKEMFAMQMEPAGVVDGSGYHAVFCVSEEFGCNKWEPRS